MENFNDVKMIESLRSNLGEKICKDFQEARNECLAHEIINKHSNRMKNLYNLGYSYEEISKEICG